MGIRLQPAKVNEAADIAELRRAAGEHLTLQHGEGPWSSKASEKGVLFDLRNASVFVARKRGKPIATLTLTLKKPWAIDRKFFTKCQRPLYLVSMAILPKEQRQGLGRQCIEDTKRLIKKWSGDALCLDAFDAEAGAGEFYRKCGFREVGRAFFKGCPLIYYEMLLEG